MLLDPLNGFVRLERDWQAGTVIELILPMAVRIVDRDAGAVGVRLGPLVLAQSPGEIWRPVPDAAGLGEWEISPRRSWNFALQTEHVDRWAVHRSASARSLGLGMPRRSSCGRTARAYANGGSTGHPPD